LWDGHGAWLYVVINDYLGLAGRLSVVATVCSLSAWHYGGKKEGTGFLNLGQRTGDL
jgi:hypothetical protein